MPNRAMTKDGLKTDDRVDGLVGGHWHEIASDNGLERHFGLAVGRDIYVRRTVGEATTISAVIARSRILRRSSNEKAFVVHHRSPAVTIGPRIGLRQSGA